MKVVVVDDIRSGFECHKFGCQDAVKKMKSPYCQNAWVENSLADAEVNFNEDLGVDAGYDDPWVWSVHVEVYPCAKEGK